MGVLGKQGKGEFLDKHVEIGLQKSIFWVRRWLDKAGGPGNENKGKIIFLRPSFSKEKKKNEKK